MRVNATLRRRGETGSIVDDGALPDPSLDAAAAREIGAFLEANAGRAVPPQDEALPRVTRTPWFVREHREVETPTWKRASEDLHEGAAEKCWRWYCCTSRGSS